MPLNRREFLILTGVTGASVVIEACTPQTRTETPSPVNTKILTTPLTDLVRQQGSYLAAFKYVVNSEWPNIAKVTAIAVKERDAVFNNDVIQISTQNGQEITTDGSGKPVLFDWIMREDGVVIISKNGIENAQGIVAQDAFIAATNGPLIRGGPLGEANVITQVGGKTVNPNDIETRGFSIYVQYEPGKFLSYGLVNNASVEAISDWVAKGYDRAQIPKETDGLGSSNVISRFCNQRKISVGEFYDLWKNSNLVCLMKKVTLSNGLKQEDVLLMVSYLSLDKSLTAVEGGKATPSQTVEEFNKILNENKSKLK